MIASLLYRAPIFLRTPLRHIDEVGSPGSKERQDYLDNGVGELITVILGFVLIFSAILTWTALYYLGWITILPSSITILPASPTSFQKSIVGVILEVTFEFLRTLFLIVTVLLYPLGQNEYVWIEEDLPCGSDGEGPRTCYMTDRLEYLAFSLPRAIYGIVRSLFVPNCNQMNDPSAATFNFTVPRGKDFEAVFEFSVPKGT